MSSSITTTEIASVPENPLDGIPPLSFSVLKTKAEQTLAVKLVVDSLAQERQVVAWAMVSDPFCVAGLILAMSLDYAVSERMNINFHTSLLVYAGTLLAYLLAIRWATGQFLITAEKFSVDEFLAGPIGPDTVMAARYGDSFIGALITRALPAESTSRTKKQRVKTVEIRAWTTMIRYRRAGLGRDMVAEAIKYARVTYGPKTEVVLAKDHANAGRFAAARFMSSLDSREAAAQRVLREELAKADA